MTGTRTFTGHSTAPCGAATLYVACDIAHRNTPVAFETQSVTITFTEPQALAAIGTAAPLHLGLGDPVRGEATSPRPGDRATAAAVRRLPVGMSTRDVHPRPKADRSLEQPEGRSRVSVARALPRLLGAIVTAVLRLLAVGAGFLPTQPGQSDHLDDRRTGPADGPDPAALRRVEMARKNGKGGFR